MTGDKVQFPRLSGIPTVNTRIDRSAVDGTVSVHIYAYVYGAARWRRVREFPSDVAIDQLREYIRHQYSEALAFVTSDAESSEAA